MTRTDFHGFRPPVPCSIMVLPVLFQMPGSLIGLGSGLLGQWVGFVFLLLPALVYYVSYRSAKRRCLATRMLATGQPEQCSLRVLPVWSAASLGLGGRQELAEGSQGVPSRGRGRSKVLKTRKRKAHLGTVHGLWCRGCLSLWQVRLRLPVQEGAWDLLGPSGR